MCEKIAAFATRFPFRWFPRTAFKVAIMTHHQGQITPKNQTPGVTIWLGCPSGSVTRLWYINVLDNLKGR